MQSKAIELKHARTKVLARGTKMRERLQTNDEDDEAQVSLSNKAMVAEPPDHDGRWTDIGVTVSAAVGWLLRLVAMLFWRGTLPTSCFGPYFSLPLPARRHVRRSVSPVDNEPFQDTISAVLHKVAVRVRCGCTPRRRRTR